MEDHLGHRQRLKESYLKNGLDHFEPQHALELLLFYTIPRQDTKTLAYELLRRFGTFSGVLEAPVEELCKVKGVGAHTASLLHLIPDMSRYYLDRKNRDLDVIHNSEEAGRRMLTRFIGEPNEITCLMCLDNRGKVLYLDKIFSGTVTTTPVYLRRVVEIAMRVGAVSVVLAHNHPKGFAVPSTQDIAITREFQRALRPLELRLMDHIVVAGEDFVSMADSNLLDPL